MSVGYQSYLSLYIFKFNKLNLSFKLSYKNEENGGGSNNVWLKKKRKNVLKDVLVYLLTTGCGFSRIVIIVAVVLGLCRTLLLTQKATSPTSCLGSLAQHARFKDFCHCLRCSDLPSCINNLNNLTSDS